MNPDHFTQTALNVNPHFDRSIVRREGLQCGGVALDLNLAKGEISLQSKIVGNRHPPRKAEKETHHTQQDERDRHTTVEIAEVPFIRNPVKDCDGNRWQAIEPRIVPHLIACPLIQLNGVLLDYGSIIGNLSDLTHVKTFQS